MLIVNVEPVWKRRRQRIAVGQTPQRIQFIEQRCLRTHSDEFHYSVKRCRGQQINASDASQAMGQYDQRFWGSENCFLDKIANATTSGLVEQDVPSSGRGSIGDRTTFA